MDNFDKDDGQLWWGRCTILTKMMNNSDKDDKQFDNEHILNEHQIEIHEPKIFCFKCKAISHAENGNSCQFEPSTGYSSSLRAL